MILNETLKMYGFSERQLELLKEKAASNGDAYWIDVYKFIDSVPLLPPLSIKQAAWLFQIQRELKERCEYKCPLHKGPTDWHHPIGELHQIGLWLCQAHHSILLGRREKYTWELGLGKDIEEMRKELKELEQQVVQRYHLSPALINKH